MTRDETRELLVLITGTYPNLKLTKATIDAWATLLSDIDAVVARSATVRVLRQQEGAWWPTPGAIIREATEIIEGSWPSVDQAWGQVMAAVRKWGYMNPSAAMQDMDPRLARVVTALGWRDICEADPGVIRGQFIKLYTDAREVHRKQGPAALPPSESHGLTVIRTEQKTAALSQWAQVFGQGPRRQEGSRDA